MRNKTTKLAAVIATVRVLAEWDVSMRRSVHRQSYDRSPCGVLRKTVGFDVVKPGCNGLLGLIYLSDRSKLTRPVVAQEIPGFLPGPLRSLLFFRGHGRFLLVFLLTSSFFRHGFSSK